MPKFLGSKFSPLKSPHPKFLLFFFVFFFPSPSRFDRQSLLKMHGCRPSFFCLLYSSRRLVQAYDAYPPYFFVLLQTTLLRPYVTPLRPLVLHVIFSVRVRLSPF